MAGAITTSQPVRSIYAHVPFCHTVCGYCDFYSIVYDRDAVHPLVDALCAELRAYADRLDTCAETLFVGGGTPTTLPPGELGRLLAALHDLTEPAAELEFTVEANPATVSERTAEALRSNGVNRISLGAQSFDSSELRVLERIHRPEQVQQTVQIARRAGIAQVNLDLIFAVPGQSLESWLANLRRAVDLGPDHLSCYALTYEEGTPLFDQLRAGQVRRADEALEAEMYEATIDTLAAAGFSQYEISNFARPGCECRHNLTYWHNRPYLGVGPSASGFVDNVRYKNVPDAAQYAAVVRVGRSPRVFEERRSLDQQARETAMLELRLRSGLDRAAFRERYGRDALEFFREAVETHRADGLLEVDEGRIALTRAGLLVADTVIADFVS
ncbi:MAG: radical SAM family heme chaperone HemW [Phycisphaerae bacterium]|jgi:oxygen-independent coproporphyrinogen-3 oxidase